MKEILIITITVIGCSLWNDLPRTNGYDISEVGAIPVLEESMCIATNSRMEDVYVRVLFEEIDGLRGQYTTADRTIRLGATDLDTVVHEVSHVVDHIMRENGMRDDELEAWLQGGWTDCVLKLVKHHESKTKKDPARVGSSQAKE